MKAKEFGFWGINTPEEYGGADLDQMMMAIIYMEISKTFVPFRFGGSADNILYYANKEQKKNYLIPTINGEKILLCYNRTGCRVGYKEYQDDRCEGNEWVLNGEKTFITGGNEADFVKAELLLLAIPVGAMTELQWFFS